MSVLVRNIKFLTWVAVLNYVLAVKVLSRSRTLITSSIDSTIILIDGLTISYIKLGTHVTISNFVLAYEVFQLTGILTTKNHFSSTILLYVHFFYVFTFILKWTLSYWTQFYTLWCLILNLRIESTVVWTFASTSASASFFNFFGRLHDFYLR